MIHPVAMAGRAGGGPALERFGEISQETPVLCNPKPAGVYPMADSCCAGGPTPEPKIH